MSAQLTKPTQTVKTPLEVSLYERGAAQLRAHFPQTDPREGEWIGDVGTGATLCCSCFFVRELCLQTWAEPLMPTRPILLLMLLRLSEEKQSQTAQWKQPEGAWSFKPFSTNKTSPLQQKGLVALLQNYQKMFISFTNVYSQLAEHVLLSSKESVAVWEGKDVFTWVEYPPGEVLAKIPLISIIGS